MVINDHESILFSVIFYALGYAPSANKSWWVIYAVVIGGFSRELV